MNKFNGTVACRVRVIGTDIAFSCQMLLKWHDGSHPVLGTPLWQQLAPTARFQLHEAELPIPYAWTEALMDLPRRVSVRCCFGVFNGFTSRVVQRDWRTADLDIDVVTFPRRFPRKVRLGVPARSAA